MQTMWSSESDDSDTDDSGVESRDEKELNLTLMARVEEDHPRSTLKRSLSVRTSQTVR
jgi:hypothetical protein